MVPPGFSFRPSDEDLLVAYLKKKLFQSPLPCDVIVEADVYGNHPKDLASHNFMANRDFEWFFFTSTTRKHPGASETSRASRRAGLGRWKATKGVRTALDSKNNTIGSKQSFCYMEQNPKGGEEKTVWLMEEFSARNLRRRGSADVMRDTNKLDDWVICKIYLTPKARKGCAEIKPVVGATLEPAAKRRRMEPACMMVPPGFIFQPTDEELLDSFLMEKLLHQPLPCDIIKEADVYGNHPSNLATQFAMANRNSEWFFFTWTTRKHPDAKDSRRASRVAGQGRWKSTQSVKPVLNEEGQVIGSKQNFSYMERTPSGKEEKTIWLMEEYSIQNLRRSGDAALPMDQNRLDDWVVCKIYLTPCARKELSGTDGLKMESKNLEVLETENQPFMFPSQDCLISRLPSDTLPQLTDALDREVESCPCMLHDSSMQLPTPDDINEFLESLPMDEFLQQIVHAPDPLPQLTDASDREAEESSPRMLHHSSLQYPNPDDMNEFLESPPMDEFLQQIAPAPDTLPQLPDASDREKESCPFMLHDSTTQCPTFDEINEFLDALPIDEFLQDIAHVPDESLGVDQHDRMSLPPP